MNASRHRVDGDLWITVTAFAVSKKRLNKQQLRSHERVVFEAAGDCSDDSCYLHEIVSCLVEIKYWEKLKK